MLVVNILAFLSTVSIQNKYHVRKMYNSAENIHLYGLLTSNKWCITREPYPLHLRLEEIFRLRELWKVREQLMIQWFHSGKSTGQIIHFLFPSGRLEQRNNKEITLSVHNPRLNSGSLQCGLFQLNLSLFSLPKEYQVHTSRKHLEEDKCSSSSTIWRASHHIFF